MKRQCPVCSSTKKKLLWKHTPTKKELSKTSVDVVRCLECGMKYTTNISSFKNFKDNYEGEYTPCNFKPGKKYPPIGIIRSIWFKLIGKYYRESFDLMQGKGKRILDVGCNVGMQLKSFYERDFQCYGIDLTKKGIANAKKNLPKCKFETSLIEDCSYPDNYFDLVMANHTLEHVYEVDSFLSGIKNKLKKGGDVVFTLPNDNSFQAKVFGKHAVQTYLPFHVNFFSKRTLRALLKKHGFTNIRVRTLPIPQWWQFSISQNIRNQKSVSGRILMKINVALVVIFIPLSLIATLFGAGEELYARATK
jgi:2-polyprenyl-3-methyl-5-hydroxy-6-metoxy-1,4-benzoquinol methylase